MKAEYRRDLQNNYLILELPKEVEKEGYQIRMAEQNTIPGLLPFHSSGRDGKGYLHYEITSKQPLKDAYEKRALNYQDMIMLLTGIETVLETLQRYLLNPAQLVFDPQYIFLEPGRNKIWLCYLPGAGEDCSITLLAEFILKRLDHEERKAVALGYSFYQKASEENFSLHQTLKELLTSAREMDLSKPRESEPSAEDFYKEQEREDYSGRTEPEEYEVTHKERHTGERKKGKADMLFQIVHPAVLLSGLFLFALLEILFYIKVIHLTEAGGLFFLVISVEILINKAWKKSGKKKRANDIPWVTEEEDEIYQRLQNEMYEEAPKPQPIEETRFLAPDSGNSCLRLIYSGTGGSQKEYPDITIRQNPVTVGKIKGESEILLDSPTVSRIHALLMLQEGKYYVKDLNSKNGTFHNGHRLHPQQQCEIRDGDCIRFAEIEYRVYK